MTYGPSLPISRETHAEKYQLPGEGFAGSCDRVASGLSDGPEHFKELSELLLTQKFLPAGRIQSAIGSPKDVTPYNCFVSGTIDDSFVDGSGSIMRRLHEAAATMRKGGGIGYDFSTLRPAKSLIKKLMSSSCGPIPFMKIFDANGLCVSSAGHRRGAQMGVMRIDHPNIRQFIKMKQPPPEADAILERLDECDPQSGEWRAWHACLQHMLDFKGFNISVGITDEFMHALAAGENFKLRFGGKVYEEVPAADIWEDMMRSTWDWAEPGALFLDTINQWNNLWYCERIAATNPCGEQPLPPFGACLLGSWNLVKYVYKNTDGTYRFDLDELIKDVPTVVRAMDNVVDRARYPLREQEAEAHNKRRMGLGVTGMANAFEALGYQYGSQMFLKLEEAVLSCLGRATYRASALLAQEKGAFPYWDRERYMAGKFIQRLDDETRELMHTHGVRNSHLLSIAPTGTISLSADNISSSIEPVFAYETERKINMPSGMIVEKIQDYGARVFGVRGKRCHEVTIDEHLAVLSTAAVRVDSAVSKTCNVPSDTPWDKFKDLYRFAWEAKCKGITTYQVGGRRAGILTSKDEGEGKQVEACRIDPETGRKNCE